MRSYFLAGAAALFAAFCFPAFAHDDGWFAARIGPTPDKPGYSSPFYDVDTMHLTIDMGFMGLKWYGPVRIYCINGAEIRPLKTREIATEQRDFGASLAPEHSPAQVRFHGSGKFGRPVVELVVGGIAYGPNVFAAFPDSMEIEAYGWRMIDQCREHLGLP